MPHNNPKKAVDETKLTLVMRSQPHDVYDYLVPQGSASIVKDHLDQINTAFQDPIAKKKFIDTISKQGYIFTVATLESKDNYPIEGSILLDLLFFCYSEARFDELMPEIDSYQAAFIQRLDNPQTLQNLRKHLTYFNTAIANHLFNKVFREYSIKGMNGFGYAIFSKNIKLLVHLFDRERTYPHFMGTSFSGNIVEWLYTLCCRDNTYYSFFSDIIPNLTDYINLNNRTQLRKFKLANLLHSDDNFSPLAYALKQGKGGTKFVNWLLKTIELNWIQELNCRLVDGTCPIWIPYLPDYYSFENTNLQIFTSVTNHIDIKKLLQTLLTSLTRHDDLAPFSANKRTKLKTMAKTIFNNVLNHPTLFDLLEAHNEEPLAENLSRLQQLVAYSRNKKLLKTCPDMAEFLREQTKLHSIVHVYAAIHTLLDPKIFNAANSLLGDVSPQDLSRVIELLEFILCFWEPHAIKSTLCGSDYMSLDLQSRLPAISDHYAEELDELNKRLSLDATFLKKVLQQLKNLETLLSNPKIYENSNVVDVEISYLTLEVGTCNLREFNTILDTIKVLRAKLIVDNDGFLTIYTPPKATKQKTHKIHSRIPNFMDIVEDKYFDKSIEFKTESKARVEMKPVTQSSQPETQLETSVKILASTEVLKKSTKFHKPKPQKPGPKIKLGKNSKVHENLPNVEIEHQPHDQDKAENDKPLFENNALLEGVISDIATTLKPEPELDCNAAFLGFTSLYLRKFHAEVMIFKQRLHFIDKKKLKQNEIVIRAHHKAHDHFIATEESIAGFFPQLPQQAGELPSFDELWGLMGLEQNSKKKLLASVEKYEFARQYVDKKLSHELEPILEAIQLFHIWNAFVNAHLKTLEALQAVPESRLVVESLVLKAKLATFANTLHWGFLPQRYRTKNEEKLYNLVLEINRVFSTILDNKKMGQCTRVMEHGTQPNDYLALVPGFSSDLDIIIEVDNLPSVFTLNHFNDLTVWFTDALGKVSARYTGLTIPNHLKFKSKDLSSFQSEITLSDGFKIDLQVNLVRLPHLKRYEETAIQSVIPFAMLAVDLKKGTIYNPVNSFEPGMLFTVLTNNSKLMNCWVQDATKVAFILRGLAKAYMLPIPLKPVQFLIDEIVRKAITNMLATPQMNPMNPISYLFGRKSLRIAGFHAVMIKHNLVSIFGLTLKDDGDFLTWFDTALQKMEDKKAGATRPCAQIMSISNYLSIIFHYILHRNSKQNTSSHENTIKHLKKLEDQYLYTKPGEPIPTALSTALRIEAALKQKSYALPLGHLFPLRERYQNPVGLLGRAAIFDNGSNPGGQANRLTPRVVVYESKHVEQP